MPNSRKFNFQGMLTEIKKERNAAVLAKKENTRKITHVEIPTNFPHFLYIIN
jgi:hypothetical protein